MILVFGGTAAFSVVGKAVAEDCPGSSTEKKTLNRKKTEANP